MNVSVKHNVWSCNCNLNVEMGNIGMETSNVGGHHCERVELGVWWNMYKLVIKVCENP